MKARLFMLMLLALPLSAEEAVKGGGFGAAYLPKHPKAPVADSTTDAQLRDRQGERPFGGIAPEDKRTKTYDLAGNSTFLQAAGRFTLVPKGAVLVVPEKLAALVVTAPAGTFQTWPEFLQANRSSLSTFEVTPDQASGKTPLDAAKLAGAKKETRVIVAVCQGSAVSVAAK